MPLPDQKYGQKPDLVFKGLNKNTDERAELGVGWTNADGSVTVKINPCVVVPNTREWVLTLFPRKDMRPQAMPHNNGEAF